ncbi:MAG: acyltransferase family protein [Bacteroidales bacterium]|nr:acyltransferase family protein [Bacteroidales bacterium]
MTGRLNYIDNLRVFCIFIVVFIHTAVTYSSIGSWYYNEHIELSIASTAFFMFFQSHAQAFSMSLFFFIAGYFIPASLERKGTAKFITGRLNRLGVPVLIYIFLIHPLCIELHNPQTDTLSYMLSGIKNFEFPGYTGPLWFALVLLIFSVFYALIHKKLPKIKPIPVTTVTLVLLIALVTLFAFGIRWIYPIGTAFMNLQFCFFSGYIFMFGAGIIASRQGLLEKIDFCTGKKWLWVAFGVGLPLWILMGTLGKVFEGSNVINGGMNFPAFLYALWESLFCVAFIVALIGIAKTRFNTQSALMKFISENVFGVYVIHAPVLIGISVLATPVVMNAVLKFFIIGTLAIVVSIIFSWIIRQIPFVGKYFN